MTNTELSADSAPESVRRFCTEIMPDMVQAADAQSMMADVAALVSTDRWNSFDRFHETAAAIQKRFAQVGLRTEVHPVPTGGPAGDGRWRIQQAMDVRDAGVEIVSPIREILTDYKTNPWTAVQWAAATPPEGLVGDLAVVDNLKDLEKIPQGRLKGRVVLTRTSVYHRVGEWARHGVAAIITDNPVHGIPGATRWTKLGWGGIEIEHAAERPVVLALSAAAGARLRTIVEQSRRVRVRVWNDVRYYQGTHDVVTAVLDGAADPQDEVWALAHSCEPGAVDNASGIAACIGAARILKQLEASGKLPRALRSVRFATGFECYGFFGWYFATGRLQPPLAGVVVDCVGVRRDASDGTLPWHSSVPGSADFVDFIGYPFVAAALHLAGANVTAVRRPFVSTEDTLFGDPAYGFPCPYLGVYPYRGYHTSADTPDLIDPAVLQASSVAVAAYLWFLANADSTTVVELAEWAGRHVYLPAARAAWSAEQRDAVQVRLDATLKRLQRWLWGGDREAILARMDEVRDMVLAVLDRSSSASPPVKDKGPAAVLHEKKDLESDPEAVPFRRAALAPTYENVWQEVRNRFSAAGIPKWAVYLADGNRTLSELRELISGVCDKTVTLEQVATFFRAMQEIGFVELVPAEDLVTFDRLVQDLRALGLQPGMDVMVHSSLSRIGWVKGGADTVVDALIEVLGPESTLLMPSFNHRAAQVFNPMTTPTINGAIPDAFWRRPGVVRSLHPTHAVAALGPKAKEWLERHVEVGIWAAESPIGRLVYSGGWILGLGVDHTTSTAYHVGEVSLDVPCLDQFGATGRIVGPDGEIRTVPSLAWRDGPCPVSPSLITEELDRRGVQRRGKVGNADSVLCPAIEVWRVRREQIRSTCPTCPVRPRADTPPPALKRPPGAPV